MTILLQPLRHDDISAYTRAGLAAFKSHPRTAVLWPRGYTEDFWAYNEAAKRKAFADRTCTFFKLVDTETNALVGGAEWTLALEPQDFAAKEPIPADTEPPSDWPLDGNWAVRRWFLINSQRLLNQYMSAGPYIMPEYLTVDENYQRRGLGAQLLNWGVVQADRLKCRMCLESTPAGLALYKKFGFVAVETVMCDMRALGATTDYRDEDTPRIFMIREPGAGKPAGLVELELTD